MGALFVYLPRTTLDYLSKRIPSINSSSRGVTQEELDKIDYVNLNYVDVMYLQYFTNLKTLIIDGFPGADDRNFGYIARSCPNITTLVVKGQPSLTKIDLTRFTKLKNVSIISNENLRQVVGLEGNSDFVQKLDKIEFYDNINYHKEDELIENLGAIGSNRMIELDALYYIDANEDIEDFSEKYDNFEWHEKIGFIHQKDLKYSSGEMEVAYNYAKSIIDTIIKSNDSEEMKIFTIYTWILKNIKIDDIREINLNEGILNVFKYRVASYPTLSKYFQFLLRVAGIESYDINVLPRIRFNNSLLGTFEIPSNDYEIIKIPTKRGNQYFDIVWDHVIYDKTGKLSTVFMYNGLQDIIYNHQLLFDGIGDVAESMPFKEREEYSKKASKRLQNVKSPRVNRITSKDFDVVDRIIASHSAMQSCMVNYMNSIARLRNKKSKLEEKMKNGTASLRTSDNIKNLDIMLEAVDSSNKVLRENIYRLEELLLEKLAEEDLSFIEVRLGDIVSPFKKKKISENVFIKVTKTKDDLEKELKKVRNALNREVTNKLINLLDYRTIIDKVTKLYTYLITFAYEKAIIMDSIEAV